MEDELHGRRPDPRYLVPALSRGLDILETLSGERRRGTLSDIATALGVTRSSAYRLLYTLSHLGFVEYNPQAKSYALGPKILHLGYGYLASRDLVEVATPHLVRLRDRTGWSSHLGELQGREVVYLARIATTRSVASTVHVGTRLPASVTTMGRVLLSGLTDDEVRNLYRDEVMSLLPGKGPGNIGKLLKQLAVDRANGVVVQNSVYEPGVASVAAPICDVTGRIVSAVNISAIAILISNAELNGPLKAKVVATAQAISRELGRKAAGKPGSTDQPSTKRSAG